MRFTLLTLLVMGGLALAADPPVEVRLGGPRDIRGSVAVGEDYSVTVTFLPVKVFDAATNEEVNRDLGREFVLRVLAQHLSKENDVRFETAREDIIEVKQDGDRYRVSIRWPKAGVRIVTMKEERTGGRVVSPTAFTNKFFTAKQDYLDTIAALAARNTAAIQNAREKARTASDADRRRILARAITEAEDRGLAAFDKLAESVKTNASLLDLTERPEVMGAITAARKQLLGDLRQAIETPLAPIKLPFKDIQIEPPFDGYLTANPLAMELAGGIQVDTGNGRKILIGVAKTVLEDGSASDLLRVERVCTVKARAAAIGERDGTTVSYLKKVEDKIVLVKDDKGESAKSASERLTVFREEVKGKVKNLGVVGRWRSEDGRTFYLAVGGPLAEE